MNGKERILAVLNKTIPDQAPTFEWFIDKRIGRELIGSEDPIEIVEQLDIDGINIRADYNQTKIGDDVYMDEWGSKRQLTGDMIAAHRSHPIADLSKHKNYTFPDPLSPKRFTSLKKAIDRFGNKRAVILNLRDGFSDMRDLLGYENALISMLLDPEAYMELLDRVVDYNLILAERAVKEFGIEIVATTDDIANAGGLLIEPETYFETLGKGFSKVMKAYKDLGLRIIKHCDGDCTPVIDFWIESGIDCLDPIDPGAGLKMETMKKQYGLKIALKGNIDCTGNLCTGTPRQIEEEVIDCFKNGGANGGLILSSSNTIHRGVKPENYKAMLEAIKKHGTYI